jgi:hypothetical protein
MRLTRERVNLILTEERRDRFEHLTALLARDFGRLDRLPVTVTPRRAEAAWIGELVRERFEVDYTLAGLAGGRQARGDPLGLRAVAEVLR